MSRCDYDGVFYRVFCVTLLATAFTFTVILTNVFIDIDGLLSNKAKQNQERKENIDYSENDANNEVTNLPYNPTGENIYEKNYIDDQPETPYRTKRSLDLPNSPSYMKNHKMIANLIYQLTKLDKLLDNELIENSNNDETANNFMYDKLPTNENYAEDNGIGNPIDISKNKKAYNYNLHRVMHKILLNGITEHKDINDVYNSVKKLLKKFNSIKTSQSTDKEIQVKGKQYNKYCERITEKLATLGDWQITSDEDIQFLNELIKCEQLQKEIIRTKKSHVTPSVHTTTISPLEDLELLVKTVVKTKPLELKKVRNGKFRQVQAKRKSTPKRNHKHLHDDKGNNYLSDDKQNANKTFELEFLKRSLKNDPNLYKIINIIPEPNNKLNNLKKALKQLGKHFLHNKEYFAKLVGDIDKNDVKRAKRQIKVKYEAYKTASPKIKPVRKGNRKPDDELYVEIETHFDGTGARGEKKKKLVKNLIDRIQKAIRSDISHDNNKKKLRQQMHIKKRIQNPIKYKNEQCSNNYMFKMQSVEHRQLNPINKILPENDMPQEKEGERIENWENPYVDPNSFTVQNVEGSEEISNPVLGFNNVLNSGIPQRVQVPLNTHSLNVKEKSQNTNSDKSNVTLFIKDIDGSGFSVGFNQYMDEPPDVDSMKLFSGLENLIETYHENYDQNNNENANANEIDESIEKQHELMKRDTDLRKNEHILLRRSVQELNNEDYHSNAYKVIFDKKFLPYDNYGDILQRPNQKSLTSDYEYKIRNYNYNPKNIKIFTKDIKIKALPVILDNDILQKKLKPSEILSLASLLINNNNKNRKKRSLNVKKITNLKSRLKINRYINTNDMLSRTIFLKNKRNKREVNKIRIIASDNLHDLPKNSEENIFLVSGENLFTNRAVLREIELPESDTGDEGAEDHNDETLSYGYVEPNSETSFITNIFDAKYRHNALMSKYPHLFTTSVMESKEMHFGNSNEYGPGRSDNQKYKLENLLDMHETENKASTEKDIPVPDIVNALMPAPSKSNYKVTVKISPKNLTNAPSGFKEMHTVINKTYNNNGVQYYSLVNVSEISKIEKINKTKETLAHSEKKSTTMDPNTQRKNDIKLLLALQKQKIEQQLQNLNKQKESLETILRERDGIKERNMNDLLKEFIHGDTHKPGEDLAFVHEPYTGYIHKHKPVTIEYSTATTSLSTVKPMTTTTMKGFNKDMEKNKVITPAKENENITNEILSKINKNTDILQCFLQKLSDKFDQQLSVRTSSTTHHSPTIEHVTEVSKHLRDRVDMPKDWGLNLHHLHDSFFNDHIPSKNDSHYAIPFVYAYQHPYLPQSKQPIPMAKIVYHGHIHTNAVHKHPNDQRSYNTNNGDNSKHHHHNTSGGNHDGSKFFIDTLARERVEIPPTHAQIPEIHTIINTTNMY